MKELGVSFKGPLALANLAGTKTQTRRLVSSPMWSLLDVGPVNRKVWNQLEWESTRVYYQDDGGPGFCVLGPGGLGHGITPRYRVGDRIWQREECVIWRDPKRGFVEADSGPVFMDDPRIEACLHDLHNPPPDAIADKIGWWKKAPSIHMPRWASRGLFEITDVRGEFVQDISPRDAWAEGFKCGCTAPCPICKGNCDAFLAAFESIYGPGNHPVWAFTYKRIG